MKRQSSQNIKKISPTDREQILQSMLASFKIEGITIPADIALATLKTIELNLGKPKQ